MRKRYYFDVREGDDISPDDEGMELGSLEDVQTEAARALTEMARDTIRKRVDGAGHRMTIDVRDDDGPVLQVDFTLVIVRHRHRHRPWFCAVATIASLRLHHLFYQDCDPVQRLLVGDARCYKPVMRNFVIEWDAFGAHDSPQNTRRELVELSVTDVPKRRTVIAGSLHLVSGSRQLKISRLTVRGVARGLIRAPPSSERLWSAASACRYP
jgi:hypothetical protein